MMSSLRFLPDTSTPVDRPLAERYAQAGVLLLLVAWWLGGVLGHTNLYGDGAHFLVSLLREQAFVDFDKPRIFVQWLTQFPVVLGMRDGVTDRQTLVFLQGLGLSTPPFLMWLAALLRSRQSDLFWPLVMIFAVTALNTSFFIIGEYNSAYAGAALAMTLLVVPVRLGPAALLLLLCCACLLLRAYESLLYLAPLLTVSAALRFLGTPSERRGTRLVIAVVGGLFALSVAVALHSILVTRAGTAAQASGFSMIYKNPQFVVSALVCMLYLLSQITTPPLASRLQRVCIALALLLFIPVLWAQPDYHYRTRTLAGLFLLSAWTAVLVGRTGLASRLLGHRLIPEGSGAPMTGAMVWGVPSLVMLALSASFLTHSWQFPRFIRSIEAYVNQHHGVVPLNVAAPSLVQAERYGWTWTYPSLSVLVRRDEHAAIILNADSMTGWQPFDPRQDPNQLPLAYMRTPLHQD